MKKIMKAFSIFLIAVIIVMGAFVIYSVINLPEDSPLINAAPRIDVSSLEGWCGDGSGLKMVGAVYEDDNHLAADDGGIWEWNGEIEEDGFYLLWISDNGTPRNKTDDYLAKVWEENF